jgi:hypothetical protein
MKEKYIMEQIKNNLSVKKIEIMEKHYTLRSILSNLINNIKKQDFLVYFRKISILEISETKIKFGVLS